MASINTYFDIQNRNTGHDGTTPQPNSPIPSPGLNRRTLLLVYVHGFMGSNVSFQNFPQHLQHILSVKLQDVRDVQTKIYPTFKTKDKIDVAVEGISRWLTRFENDHTDVVLVGHSMGGLVTAELALKQHRHYPNYPQHRILGLLCIDVPFYGLHPGIVPSGLASIFKPPPPPSVAEPLLAPRSQPFLKKAFNFIKKYSDDLPKATARLVTSHLEFGGALGDWKGLYGRWKSIVELEEGRRWIAEAGRTHVVNYYTVSLGDRPSELEEAEDEENRFPPPPPTGTVVDGVEDEDIDLQTAVKRTNTTLLEVAAAEDGTPARDGPVLSPQKEAFVDGEASAEPTRPPPRPPKISVSEPPPTTTTIPRPVPPIPNKPPYLRATPSNSTTATPPIPHSSTPTDTPTSVPPIPHSLSASSLERTSSKASEASASDTASTSKKSKPKKPRKFCLLPPKSPERDRIWVPHYIYSHSEVTAHCAVFLVDADDGGARYQGLLDDVAERIEGWVADQIAV
ncbi:hypothetical protein BJ508DRAFT_414822 [Ascobolus immersus RN42]|uniref:AB hydrolase-1 domain-containing protein n=1 Tax=Ascobolus immersus RN42 TaxID=1160509 RepID=A0A3N4I7D5_ASCIM|nr:hypothetical protein BJ508DRAFT_414822 [Ascobolus immersus RN42]